MLHRRRERLRQLAEQEAQGASFWTTEFSQEARTRIWYAFDDLVRTDGTAPIRARALILRDEGLRWLMGSQYSDYGDLRQYVKDCSDEMMPSVVEALLIGIKEDEDPSWGAVGSCTVLVQTILREHRISYDLVNGHMVPYASQELHQSVVSPALVLISERPELDRVESAYQEALAELASGSVANSITDAGTALQEMLKYLGCSGSALGPLIKSARQAGYLAAHDGPMLEGILRVLHWVAADRSELGDSHQVADPAIADAWFTVHVVGAVILRLASSEKRST